MVEPQPFIIRRQPFKGLYLAYILGSTVFVRLPFWTITYLPRRNRPSPKWSLLRSIIVVAYRSIITKLAVEVGSKTSHDPPELDDELKDAKFVWIDGLTEESDAFCGEVRRAAGVSGVKPSKVGGYWFLKPGAPSPTDTKAKPGEVVAMHIHGGAFHLGSAHPESVTSSLSRGLLEHSSKLERVLAVEYRLSAAHPDPPANPFPAALLDCLAAYRYLVKDLGFDAKNITLAGDSAGGNIAFALVRHLVENAIPGLPPPGRLLSCSAWLDLSESRDEPDSSLHRNRRNDILGMGPRYPRAAYLGPLDPEEAKTNRYISPISSHFDGTRGLFKGFPRTYISAGGLETLLDDSTRVAEKLKEDGVEVVLDVEPDSTHDFTVFAWHEPERTQALQRFAKWLDE
ncbi:alpha/beta-hydrolase [Polyporus arcularius HHB13444]|uniref:Alpha/beta-hydrolase n=1 Tax=Polyporus arcularius HHB13444 TaxID=1314778 RepID=A0A5C3PTM1_9APHY|nr:alpha/beta-hydrolase [Polyporus arcularius HHB13444]